MIRKTHWCVALALAVTALGCGPRVGEKEIEVKADNDPLVAARAVIQRYAEGQPLSSEVTSFPKLVEDVRAKDPQRADVLEKGLEDLQKAPAGARQAKAKELLKKLQPSMT
jgi:septation ring formation regulator EzrA